MKPAGLNKPGRGSVKSQIQSGEELMEAGEAGVEKLRALRRLLSGTDNDLAKITEDMLPAQMLKLKSVSQNPVHGGMNPLEHTFNMLARLNTAGVRYPELLRAASVFHDIGKIGGAEKTDDFFEHPNRSAEIAQTFLEKMGYQAWQVDVVKQLIKTHNLLGRAAQRDEDTDAPLVDPMTFKRQLTPPPVARDKVSTSDMLEMHYRIIKADIQSIPGLAKYEPDIDKEYQWYRRYHIPND
jgi:hypothetical protein